MKPLSREQVRRVIRGPWDRPAGCRVPMIIHMWVDPVTFGEHKARAEALLAAYPCDVQIIGINMPAAVSEDPEGYAWVKGGAVNASGALDSSVAIERFEDMDRIEQEFPRVRPDIVLPWKPEDDGRYRLGLWWYCLFERHWSLRGMENALTDFYLYPEETHRLYGHLTDFYCETIVHAHEQGHLDGIMFSDDIGQQTGPFFSVKIFDEFYRPYYTRLCRTIHDLGMEVWLHSCGNIQPLIPPLIECGFDVLHPIQKYTMDEREIARLFGRDICILGGMDVQQTIPWKPAEDVRKEVRFMYDTYLAESSRFMITAGNGITPDCRIDALEAFLDESYRYRNPDL